MGEDGNYKIGGPLLDPKQALLLLGREGGPEEGEVMLLGIPLPPQLRPSGPNCQYPGQQGAQALHQGAGDSACPTYVGRGAILGGGDICQARGHH